MSLSFIGAENIKNNRFGGEEENDHIEFEVHETFRWRYLTDEIHN